jgi:hypothetical protein
MSSNTPRKGDIIINPKTQRPVKVGSRTWLKLVKEGLVEGRYSDPNELYEVKQPNQAEVVEQKIEELNQTLPSNQQAVRGRGRYKNKIVKRHKQPSTREITEHTAKTAARTVSQNIESLSECEDLEAQLENLIMNEILGQNQNQNQNQAIDNPVSSPLKRGRPRKIQIQESEKYEIEEPPLYDQEEETPEFYDDC